MHVMIIILTKWCVCKQCYGYLDIYSEHQSMKACLIDVTKQWNHNFYSEKKKRITIIYTQS